MSGSIQRATPPVFPGWGLGAEDTDIHRRQVGSFKPNALGMQPMIAGFTVLDEYRARKRETITLLPLNHEMAAIIHGATDTSGAITWVAVPLCGWRSNIRIRHGGGRCVGRSRIEIQLCTESRRGRVQMSQRDGGPIRPRPIADGLRSWDPPPSRKNFPKCVLCIAGIFFRIR